MSAPYIVITASNEPYRRLLLDWVRSLRALNTKLDFDIGILDVGLSEETRQELAAFDVIIKPAEADIEYPGRLKWEAEAFYYRTLTARPFLPRYFPGYQSYMWVDADAWFQTPEALEVMLPGAAAEPAIYIVPEVDRNYIDLTQRRLEMQSAWTKAFYGDDLLKQIYAMPCLNAGVFAMSADCPVWNAWHALLAPSLQRYQEISRAHFMMDQVALNMVIYIGKLLMRPMPTEFNWLPILSVPVYDEAANAFYRPTLPRHAPLSIIHLADDYKDGPMEHMTTGGQKRCLPLTYSATVEAAQQLKSA